MRFCAQTTLCLLMTLIAAKGGGIAQLRYQKREKAVSLPKISINIFGLSRGGVSRETYNLRFLWAKSICEASLNHIFVFRALLMPTECVCVSDLTLIHSVY